MKLKILVGQDSTNVELASFIASKEESFYYLSLVSHLLPLKQVAKEHLRMAQGAVCKTGFHKILTGFTGNVNQ